MSSIDGFDAYYGEGYEDILPHGLTEEYAVMECLNCTEGCDTLLARHKTTGKKVVVKCYTKDSPLYGMADSVPLKDIGNEAIPRFIGECSNGAYRCVMREYIEGTPLDEFVRAQYMTQDVVTELAIKLASTMQSLHESEMPVIHRDIKPRNIIVKNDGGVALIDLGISRIYKKDRVADTVFSGTEDFAPPEQYGFMQTDTRSDIYSFGIVLAWMITGKAKPITEPLTRLEKVAAKCCEFSPNRRYKNDRVLLKDLRRATREYRICMRRVMKCAAACCLLLSVLASAGKIWHRISGVDLSPADKAVTFQEPLIEEAVRAMLGRPQGAITYADLELITGIYIQAGQIYLSSEDFYIQGGTWYEDGIKNKGPIKDLSDLANMPNLYTVLIGGEYIRDISPLAGLTKLQHVDLRDNEISDLSPLTDMDTLIDVSVGGNWLDDIDAVCTWPVLKALNLNDTGKYDASPLAGLERMSSLDIFNASDAYRYLDCSYIEELMLGAVGQTDLECIDRVGYVSRLYIRDSDIHDISALKGRADITYLNIEGCMIDDLSVLYTMPGLKTIEMDAGEERRMEGLACTYGEPTFTIVYIE